MTNMDFSVYKGKSTIKSFTITNPDGTVYPLTGSTVRLDIWQHNNPTRLFTLTGAINTTTGVVTINFSATETVNEGLFDYKLIETKTDTSEWVLIGGNLSVDTFLDQTLTTKAFLTSEFPSNFTINEDFVNQKIIYWKYFLYSAAGLAEPFIDSDANWPIDWRMLIAKLIAHDMLVMSLRASLIASAGSSSEEAGSTIKSIETGPTKVEFGDSGTSINNLLKPGSTGESAITMLATDICGLANRLRVKVPPCKAVNFGPVIPKYYQHDDRYYISLESTVVVTSPSKG